MRFTRQMPPVCVTYDGPTGRRSKRFDNAYAARRFYAAKLAKGKRPAVARADS